jgi:hypothetical protein
MDTFWTPELRSVDYAGVDFTVISRTPQEPAGKELN